MMKEAKKERRETVKVRLTRPHTHRGREYEAGAEIEVTKRQAEWLKRRKACA